MKKFTLILSILFLSFLTYGQSILFTSEFGGENNNGAIMNYDISSGQLNTFKSLGGNFQYGYNFLINQGFTTVLFSCGLTLGQDGNYYGINEFASGIFNGIGERRGVFYRMDPVTHETEILYSFTGAGAFELGHQYTQEAYNEELGFPAYNVVETYPGVFWGISAKGGTSNLGGIWKFDVNLNTYSKIAEFDENTTGYDPLCPMIIGPNNNLYGLLRKKGTEDNGYVYRVNTTTNALDVIGDLDAGSGWAITSPNGNIVYLSGSNKIYGVKNHFSGASYGGGVFSYDLGTNQATNETFIDHGQIPILGSHPRGMMLANDGKMYFVCDDGGAHNQGTLVQYTPGVNTMVKMKDFHNPPRGTGFHAVGPKIYGVYDAPHTASGNGYAMWSFDVTSNSLQNIIPVSDSLPGYMMKHFAAYDNGKIIGHFMNGGPYDAGSFFEYDITLGQTTVIQENASTEGRSIIGELCKINDSVLIGFTGMGGNGAYNWHSELGNLIKVNIQTGDIEKLHGWSNSDVNDHTFKSSRPIYAANGKLYYCYVYIGWHGTRQHLAEYDFNTNQPTILIGNDVTDNMICGPLEHNNNIVFAWRDSVYVYDFNQQSFTVRKYSHDASLYGGMKGNIMLASDGRIYGTTQAKHTNPTTGHDAVIYSLDVTNFDFQVEHTFDNVVRNTNIGLTELNGKLWGSTSYGGTNSQGYLFSYNLSNSTFTNEYSFNASVDGGGFEAEWTPVNGKLYSTSYTGGPNGFGTLVEFNPSTSQFTVLENLTIDNGRSFRGSPIFVDLPEIISISPNSGPQNLITTATITGSNTYFTNQPNVTLVNTVDPNETIDGIIQSIQSDTEMTVDFDIPINATPGLWDLIVGTSNLEDAFTITQVYPTILSIDPSTSEAGVLINSEITGENTQWMTSPTPVVKMIHHDTPGYEIIATNIVVVNDQLITADFDIPDNAFTGNYDVHVDNLVLVNGFSVLLPNVSVLHSITPDTEIQGNTVVCTIEAFYTTFTQGGIPDVLLEYTQNPSEIIVGQNVTVLSETELEVTFDILHYSSTGLYNLYVDNLDLMDAFTVLSSGAGLTIIDPDNGMIGDFLTTEISATGTQFTQYGVNSVYMSYNTNPGEVINAISYAIINDTIIEATFGFPANTTLGMYDVWVDYYSLIDGFELMDQNKYIVGIDPDSAYQGDFIPMEISTTGTFFTQGSPDIYLENSDTPGEIINSINVNVINDTMVIAEFGFPYNSTTGLYDLKVDDMIEDMAFTLLLVTSVKDNLPDAVQIYPNPFKDHIVIAANQEIKHIEVYNNVGASVLFLEPNTFGVKVETNMLIKGLYFVKVEVSDGKYVIRKIIK